MKSTKFDVVHIPMGQITTEVDLVCFHERILRGLTPANLSCTVCLISGSCDNLRVLISQGELGDDREDV